jgi:hypothetical protein
LTRAPEEGCVGDRAPAFRIPNRAGGRERRDRTRKSARSALRSHAALRVQAERLVAAYVAPESNREAIINKLIVRFDGPAQREARMLTAEAKGEAWRERLPLRSQATFLPGSIGTIDASARNKGQKRSVGGA